MTTIAYRDGIISADTGIFDRGCYVGIAQKIHRHESGALLACTGRVGDMQRVAEWFSAGRDASNPPKFHEDDSEALIVEPDGRVFWLGHDCQIAEQIGCPFIAAGSGFKVALGAMAAGASAEEAIRICCEFDSLTRAPIVVLQAKAT